MRANSGRTPNVCPTDGLRLGLQPLENLRRLQIGRGGLWFIKATPAAGRRQLRMVGWGQLVLLGETESKQMK